MFYYWRIPLSPQAWQLPTFSDPFGQFRHRVNLVLIKSQLACIASRAKRRDGEREEREKDGKVRTRKKWQEPKRQQSKIDAERLKDDANSREIRNWCPTWASLLKHRIVTSIAQTWPKDIIWSEYPACSWCLLASLLAPAPTRSMPAVFLALILPLTIKLMTVVKRIVHPEIKMSPFTHPLSLSTDTI